MMPTQKAENWQDMGLCFGAEPTNNFMFYSPEAMYPTSLQPMYPLNAFYHPLDFGVDQSQLLFTELLPAAYDDSAYSSQPVSRTPSQAEIQPLPSVESSPSAKSAVRLGYPETTRFSPGVHIPRTKPTILSKDPSKSKKCGICQQPFERDNSLRRHEMLHSGVKPFKCKPCNKEFTRQDIYRRHQQSSRCKKATERCQRFIFAYNK
ncbi:hypothetical protein DSO57_1025391 [Entomophthora muscae]|uniref:Uncharacterized protein n=1 Tax=Entomophthora muscae TaxID=34485 RepID=A0ACC2S4A0_9FUNG|nr:hypothetical protein DSO57_1025391 [Entomophthora muscae]